MDRNNDAIMSNQLYSILVTNIIGVGILSLPRGLAEKAGPDSLIVLIIGSILFLILALLMQNLARKFPQKTIIEISDFLLFKPVGIIIAILYFIYLMLITVLEIRAFGEITKNFLLINTPIEVIIITFLLTLVYVVRSGIESIARLSVMLLPLSIFPALIVMLVTLPDLDPTYFLPILRTPLLDIVKAIPQVFFSFLGFELIILLSYFVKDTKNLKHIAISTIGFVSVVYFIFTAVTISRFGIVENKNLIWPVVTLFKSVKLPGAFLENVEVVIMSTWLLSIFMTVAISYYTSTFLIARIFKSKEHNYLAVFLMPLIFVMTLVPENVVEVYDYLDKFSIYFGSVMMFIIPITLFLISIVRKKPKKGMKKNG